MALLGIDVGTSGVKVILLSPEGKILANVTEEYPLSRPQPLWSEQDPHDWWHATCRAIAATLAQARLEPADVQAVGLSGQMVGLVALDHDGNVIRPCILWNDQRSAKETEELTARIGLDTILKETSNPLFASFVAPKIVWMRQHEPANYQRIHHVLMPKDYIAYRLTGRIGTEVSDASGTCLFNIRDRRWSPTMLDALDIPQQWLPPCTESDQVIGALTPAAHEHCPLPVGTPVVAGAGDQPAQALGSGIVKPGLCSVTIGTSGVVFAQADQHIQHPKGLLHAFCHCLPDQWYLMGVMLSAGASFQWLRDTIGALAPVTYDQLTDLAASVPPGSESLIFLPYLTGERVPHDDPHARGAWIGLTQRHTAAHLTRAVMEGITFGLCDSVRLMEDLGLHIDRIYASGGAVRSKLWLQMLADVFNKEIVVTNVAEGAAYGAAMLAGIGIKTYANARQAAQALITVTQTVQPDPQQHRRYEEIYAVYRSLYAKLKLTFSELTSLTAAP